MHNPLSNSSTMFCTLSTLFIAAFIQFADLRDAEDACRKLDGAPTALSHFETRIAVILRSSCMVNMISGHFDNLNELLYTFYLPCKVLGNSCNISTSINVSSGQLRDIHVMRRERLSTSAPGYQIRGRCFVLVYVGCRNGGGKWIWTPRSLSSQSLLTRLLDSQGYHPGNSFFIRFTSEEMNGVSPL